MSKAKFLRCELCKNLFSVINDSGVIPICCNQPMDELVANSTDAAGEKHVPVVERKGDTVTVKVGSAEHPMEKEHYIQWIVLVQKDRMQRVDLQPGQKPEATFPVSGAEPITVYEYCNLHGLWKTEK